MSPKISKENFQVFLDKFGEVGTVEMLVYPIAQVRGLPSVRPHEVIIFETGDIGQVLSVGVEYVDVLTFSTRSVAIGVKAARTGRTLQVPVGDGLLGKMVDPLGRSLYKAKPSGVFDEYRSIENEAPGIAHRKKIVQPLETGVSVVDMMVPLGKGQRQLVIGDRKTGKTNFLLQTVLKQARAGSICIYAAIGKKKTDIIKIGEYFEKNGIANKTVVVGTSSTDSVGIVYLTPYSAMTIAEYFKDAGHNVVIVMDDLSIHAKAYREISLLGKNFPGRSAYPGDIFYTHARLVERAGSFKTEDGKGEVSITCLPVAETIEGDISGYIQTNLMSMTDGHIYFDKDLFAQGRRPAVNFFLSVTRVGRQTQTPVRSGINRELNNFLSLHEKTQSFVHFGAELSEGVRATLAMGDRVLNFFNQPPEKILDIDLQILLFCLIWVGTWNKLTREDLIIEIHKIMSVYENDPEIRKLVGEYVTSAADFNALLGRVSAEAPKVLEAIQNSMIARSHATDGLEGGQNG